MLTKLGFKDLIVTFDDKLFDKLLKLEQDIVLTGKDYYSFLKVKDDYYFSITNVINDFKQRCLMTQCLETSKTLEDDPSLIIGLKQNFQKDLVTPTKNIVLDWMD